MSTHTNGGRANGSHTNGSHTNDYVAHAPGYVDNDGPKVVTSRFTYDDSHTLERSLATGGYDGLKKALQRTPADVAAEVKDAILLGRGGAGFPAGIKWGFMPPVWPRYLVVNGDESEPGTYKDRLLMERDPHQLIEGCVIACYALGLNQCFLYVRGEMAQAQENLAVALNEAYAAGFVGKNILGTDVCIDVVLHWGAGAYIVGEETALIESLEGNRGMPRLKPPFGEGPLHEAHDREQRGDPRQPAVADGERRGRVQEDRVREVAGNPDAGHQRSRRTARRLRGRAGRPDAL